MTTCDIASWLHNNIVNAERVCNWHYYCIFTDSKTKDIRHLTVFINDEFKVIQARESDINLTEGATLSVIFRVFGIWSLHSPECYSLIRQSKGRIQCRYKYPCNSEVLGRKDPAATFLYHFNPIKLSDNGIKIRFHNPNHNTLKIIRITGKNYTIYKLQTNISFVPLIQPDRTYHFIYYILNKEKQKLYSHIGRSTAPADICWWTSSPELRIWCLLAYVTYQQA